MLVEKIALRLIGLYAVEIMHGSTYVWKVELKSHLY